MTTPTLPRSLALAALVVLSGPPGAATAVAARGAPAAAPPTTTVTLTMRDCSGCRIAAYNTLSPAFGTSGQPLGTGRVHRGRVVFTVPTALTKGLAFTLLSSPTYALVGSHPDFALDVAGIHAGRAVSTRQARTATGARRCWAGTAAAAVTIPISTFTYRAHDYTQDNKLVTSIAFWASVDQKGTGDVTPFDNEERGVPGVAQLADQDAPYCTG